MVFTVGFVGATLAIKFWSLYENCALFVESISCLSIFCFNFSVSATDFIFMFFCALKKELIVALRRLETNYAYFSHVKLLVFKTQGTFSKLSEAESLDEQNCIFITSTPFLYFRTKQV